MSDLYTFRWPVDQHGYTVEHIEADHRAPDTILSGRSDGGTFIRARGGPPRYIEPMSEHPGLWRRFAEECVSLDGILSFVTEFGLLGARAPRQTWALQSPLPPQQDNIEHFYRTAKLLSLILWAIDSKDIEKASELYTTYARPMPSSTLFPVGHGKYELRSVPNSLQVALLLQAGQAIAGGLRYRKCKNCPEWFRIGSGAFTSRREFCSVRCRVAWARKHKREETGEGEHS